MGKAIFGQYLIGVGGFTIARLDESAKGSRMSVLPLTRKQGWKGD